MDKSIIMGKRKLDGPYLYMWKVIRSTDDLPSALDKMHTIDAFGKYIVKLPSRVNNGEFEVQLMSVRELREFWWRNCEKIQIQYLNGVSICVE